MPLLLNILPNMSGSEYNKLRSKAMECVGLIGIAVGRDVLSDLGLFSDEMMRILTATSDA
ncbi:hypothetical protein NEOLEDRAFT_1140243, partial [Neolentinus lepideus HHB14362 ss-1]